MLYFGITKTLHWSALNSLIELNLSRHYLYYILDESRTHFCLQRILIELISKAVIVYVHVVNFFLRYQMDSA